MKHAPKAVHVGCQDGMKKVLLKKYERLGVGLTARRVHCGVGKGVKCGMLKWFIYAIKINKDYFV